MLYLQPSSIVTHCKSRKFKQDRKRIDPFAILLLFFFYPFAICFLSSCAPILFLTVSYPFAIPSFLSFCYPFSIRFLSFCEPILFLTVSYPFAIPSFFYLFGVLLISLFYLFAILLRSHPFPFLFKFSAHVCWTCIPMEITHLIQKWFKVLYGILTAAYAPFWKLSGWIKLAHLYAH